MWKGGWIVFSLVSFFYLRIKVGTSQMGMIYQTIFSSDFNNSLLNNRRTNQMVYFMMFLMNFLVEIMEVLGYNSSALHNDFFSRICVEGHLYIDTYFQNRIFRTHNDIQELFRIKISSRLSLNRLQICEYNTSEYARCGIAYAQVFGN